MVTSALFATQTHRNQLIKSFQTGMTCERLTNVSSVVWMLPSDSTFPHNVEHIQGFRCITDLYCQDVTSSCLPHSQTPPTRTGVEGFLTVCLFHGAISHWLFIYSKGATLSVSTQRTFNERRFVNAKIVMIVFITTSAGAMDMNHFFLADWKMLRWKENRSRVNKQSRSVTSNPESLSIRGVYL